jgi:hypothetical protein
MRIREWVVEIRIKEGLVDEQGAITEEGLRWELQKCFTLMSHSLVADIERVEQVRS